MLKKKNIHMDVKKIYIVYTYISCNMNGRDTFSEFYLVLKQKSYNNKKALLCIKKI